MKKQKITPNLWFDGNAKEAVDFYVSVFSAKGGSASGGKDAKVLNTEYYPKTKEEGLADFQKDLAGEVLTIEFELFGQRFVAINADDTFKPNEAVSFTIAREVPEEIHSYF